MKTTKLITIALIVLITLTLQSCASILSKSSYPFSINTNPNGVNVHIKNAKGMTIYQGNSPATVELKASQGFFKKASYTVNVSQEGYNSQTLPINFTLDGWYFGNLLVGGIVGLLIVDPATGAMYKLEDNFMSVTLSESNVGEDAAKLKIMHIEELPEKMRKNLIALELR